MDIKTLERHLEIWKRILFIDTGAAFTLLATGLADLPNLNRPYIPGWEGVWFVILLASLVPGFVLLWGRRWMQLPLQERLNTIFGYFAITWFTFLSLAVREGWGITAPFIYFMLGAAIAILVGYWWLRRKIAKSEREIFP